MFLFLTLSLLGCASQTLEGNEGFGVESAILYRCSSDAFRDGYFGQIAGRADCMPRLQNTVVPTSDNTACTDMASFFEAGFTCDSSMPGALASSIKHVVYLYLEADTSDLTGSSTENVVKYSCDQKEDGHWTGDQLEQDGRVEVTSHSGDLATLDLDLTDLQGTLDVTVCP